MSKMGFFIIVAIFGGRLTHPSLMFVLLVMASLVIIFLFSLFSSMIVSIFCIKAFLTFPSLMPCFSLSQLWLVGFPIRVILITSVAEDRRLVLRMLLLFIQSSEGCQYFAPRFDVCTCQTLVLFR